jgi:hypothetical protein
MHAWNVAHRDLKGCNLVLVEQPEEVDAYLIDLDGVQLKRQVNLARRAKDLARLEASLRLHDWITRADRLRFLRAYLSQLDSRERSAWKDLWRQVATQRERLAQRREATDRPDG